MQVSRSLSGEILRTRDLRRDSSFPYSKCLLLIISDNNHFRGNEGHPCPVLISCHSEQLSKSTFFHFWNPCGPPPLWFKMKKKKSKICCVQPFSALSVLLKLDLPISFQCKRSTSHCSLLPLIFLPAAAWTDRHSRTGNRDAQQPLQVFIHWGALDNITVCNSVPAPHGLLYA